MRSLPFILIVTVKNSIPVKDRYVCFILVESHRLLLSFLSPPYLTFCFSVSDSHVFAQLSYVSRPFFSVELLGVFHFGVNRLFHPFFVQNFILSLSYSLNFLLLFSFHYFHTFSETSNNH